MRARFESIVGSNLPAARRDSGVTWREQVIRLLKDSLIKELVCVIRYNHLSADVSVQPLLSAEFLLHAHEELGHAYKLARYIAELGGELEYSPHLLMRIGKATHDRHHDLKSMISANLNSQRLLVTKYTEILGTMASEDVFPRRLLAEIVKEEREHAEELNSWLTH